MAEGEGSARIADAGVRPSMVTATTREGGNGPRVEEHLDRAGQIDARWRGQGKDFVEDPAHRREVLEQSLGQVGQVKPLRTCLLQEQQVVLEEVGESGDPEGCAEPASRPRATTASPAAGPSDRCCPYLPRSPWTPAGRRGSPRPSPRPTPLGVPVPRIRPGATAALRRPCFAPSTPKEGAHAGLPLAVEPPSDFLRIGTRTHSPKRVGRAPTATRSRARATRARGRPPWVRTSSGSPVASWRSTVKPERSSRRRKLLWVKKRTCVLSRIATPGHSRRGPTRYALASAIALCWNRGDERPLGASTDRISSSNRSGARGCWSTSAATTTS